MNSMGVKRVIVGRCRRRRSLRSAPVESATAALRRVIPSGAEQVPTNSDRAPSIMTAQLYTGRERANQGGPLCSVHRSTLRSFLRFHGRTNLVLLSCRVRQLGTRGGSAVPRRAERSSPIGDQGNRLDHHPTHSTSNHAKPALFIGIRNIS